jgi:hypothetical protein
MTEMDDIINTLDNKLKGERLISSNLIVEINSSFRPEAYKNISFSSGVAFTIKEHLKMNSTLKKLKNELKASGMKKQHLSEILEIAKSKIMISRRIGWLRTMQKFFRYWHIIHLPFAIVMFVIMFIHIIVTLTFGYKWIF